MAETEPGAVGGRFLEPDSEHRARRPGPAGVAAVVADQRSAGVRQDREERVPEPGQPGRAEDVRVPQAGLPGRDRAAELPAVAGGSGDRGEGPVDRHPAVGRHEPQARVADHPGPAGQLDLVGRAGRAQVPAGAHPRPEHVAGRAAVVAAHRAAAVVGDPAGRVRQPAVHAHVAVPVRAGRPAQPAPAQRAAVQPDLLRLQRARAAPVAAGAGPGVLGARVRGRQPAGRGAGRRPDVRREPADDHDDDDDADADDHDQHRRAEPHRQGAGQGAAAARDHRGAGHHLVAAAGHHVQPEGARDRQVAEPGRGGRGGQRRHAHHRHRGRRRGVHRHPGDHHLRGAHPAVRGRVQLARERAAPGARRPGALRQQPRVRVPAQGHGARDVPNVRGHRGDVVQQQLRHAARAQAVLGVVAAAAVLQRPERRSAVHAQPLLHTVRGRRREGLRHERQIAGPATTAAVRPPPPSTPREDFWPWTFCPRQRYDTRTPHTLYGWLCE